MSDRTYYRVLMVLYGALLFMPAVFISAVGLDAMPPWAFRSVMLILAMQCSVKADLSALKDAAGVKG